jgi:hypothetical protein
MLPNLLIIGAAKCGTTSLHSYLGLHPDVFMSERKELNFWHEPDCLERLERYEAQFPTDRPIRGEASIRYTYHPIYRGTAERIHSVIPSAKLIYLVRDPVERAISHYLQAYSVGMESRGVEDAFGDLDDPGNRYVAASSYASQLDQYLAHFPPSSLLVIDQRDLLVGRDTALRKAFRFLGVDEEFSSFGFEERRNITAGKRRRPAVYARLKYSEAARLVRRLPPSVRRGAFAPVRWMLSRPALHRPLRAPAVSEGLREELASVFEPEVRRLEALTGRTFDHWESMNRARAAGLYTGSGTSSSP